MVQDACCALQNGHSDHSYADSSMPALHVDLYTGPQCRRADLEICRRPDGSPWLLGEGACGKVYKVGDCVPFSCEFEHTSVQPWVYLSFVLGSHAISKPHEEELPLCLELGSMAKGNSIDLISTSDILSEVHLPLQPCIPGPLHVDCSQV